MKSMTKVRSMMTLRPAIFAALCLSAGLTAGQAAAKEGFSDKVVTLKDGLKEMLQAKGAAKLSKLTLTPTADQKAAVQKKCSIDVTGTYTFYQGLRADGSLVGTVGVIDEAGKEGPLQMLVGLTPEGSIYDAAFTVFGEERGKPALSWNFLKQFIGKTASSPLMPGKDVDGVSGASYTSKSVAIIMKRAACVYAEVAPHGP